MDDSQWIFTDDKGHEWIMSIDHDRPHQKLAIDRSDKTPCRVIRNLSTSTMQTTANCLAALYRRTNEQELLQLAAGNKWIIRRAIELYKRNLVMETYGPHYISVDLSNIQGTFYETR